MTQDIQIDPEFRALIPPPTAEERAQLEENILRDGCRDPLVAWNGLLLDGHNRYEICAQHGIKFDVAQQACEDREAAKIWTIRNQFGRRNLSNFARAELALKLEPLITEKAKLRQGQRNDLPKKAWESDLHESEKAETERAWNFPGSYDERRNRADRVRGEYGREYRRRAMSDELQVYIAVHGDRIKVGVSATPEDRVRTLETACPGIRFVVSFPGNRKLESNILRRFAKHSDGGEWLSMSEPGLLDSVVAYACRESRRPHEVSAEIAKAAGVSHDTIAKAKVIIEKAPKPVQEKLRKGETTINRVHKAIQQGEFVEQRRVALEEAKRSQTEAWGDLRVCSMRDLLGSTRDIDAIITDPPYVKESIHLYGELAEYAARALTPDGLLAVMCGQAYLPEILALMTPHLAYRWALAYLTPGGQPVSVFPRNINAFWKPVLLFGGDQMIGDVINNAPNDRDKAFHKWGQNENGMAMLVERLTKPGDLVCDPFLGAGTTAVVCKQLARRFIGCDVDGNGVETAQLRLAAVSRPASEEEIRNGSAA